MTAVQQLEKKLEKKIQTGVLADMKVSLLNDGPPR
jgi:D-Tyr-tRNAtyr deacylase